ncbi:hypothetical protein L2E82_14747 [Cichorium intybus]|uniref:Uncharacterized protein n=1 Tax=Cichorium intybus TaxID=13427 RepID=A0ACB9F0V8_CICIN|nr:hypothetical protein L2E82_14747 [Cichorium intybus]
MPPRKKAAAATGGSKKSNQIQHQSSEKPSKFGIQHFFERHTQNSLSQNPQKQQHTNAKVSSVDVGSDPVRLKETFASTTAAGSSDSGINPRNELGSGNANKEGNDGNKNPSQSTPVEELISVVRGDASGNLLEVSPEFCKSVSRKRIKFSPGMLIDQSQDDGGDEVTWRISPVNERLHALTKNLVDVRKLSPCSTVKLERFLSSPPMKASENSLKFINLEKRNLEQDLILYGNNEKATDKNNVDFKSPFKTPPSCHDKTDDTNGESTQLGSRQHKKALLELLDQVEDVICVEDQVVMDTKTSLTSHQNKHNNQIRIGSTKKVKTEPSNVYFLVFEVSEKQFVGSNGSQSSSKVLRLLNEQCGEERSVYLSDEWFYSVISPGDTVHVIGEFNEEGKCDVNHDKGFLIVHPDILVSGTRVAGSFSCPRRTVLDERLKSNEQSSSALLGTLLHQLFQAGLIKETPTKGFLEDYARILLQKNYESLYACGVYEGDVHKTMIEAIPKLLNWILLFRDSQGPMTPNVDFGSSDGLKKVKITEVIDIEEMAWAPKYGMKGVIDASMRVKVTSKTNETTDFIMPLEFKTGKATNGQAAMEHCAQVMLYTLLMSERYKKKIDYGLLYYLHTDQTQGITVKRSDLVGLIMRRNELASDILKASMVQQLPPMLQVPNMCKSCRHLNACTVYHKAHNGNVEGSGLGDVYSSLVSHLTTAHCVFLKKWERLIDLEANELEVVKKDMWGSQGLKSQHSSTCLPSIVLDTSDQIPLKNITQGNRFVYRFIRHDVDDSNPSSSGNDLECSLKTGDYVILCTDPNRLVVGRGVIMDITRTNVMASFSKRLRLPGSSPSRIIHDLCQEVWRIDKDEFTASFATMRFNLIQMFLQDDRSSHLRSMIVDLHAPRYDGGCIFSQDPAISYIWSEKTLNDDQRKAILKILTAKDYTLILGMPGTGKTSTMVHAVKALLMRGATILLTSYTNSAVDNLLIKLKSQGIDFIRIGREEAVHEEIRGHCINAVDMKSTKDIKVRLDEAKVVAVTCLGITSPLLSDKKFDVCIMDEAGQITLPVSLGPLMFASMFVLVGDHYQLPPLVQSTEARENGMGVSLFCRLSEAHPQAISALQSQYRMCAPIMELSNALIYGNRLRCGSPDVANAKLEYTTSTSSSLWLKKVLDPSRQVIFINTDLLPALEVKEFKTVNNPLEAYIITEITVKLTCQGIKGEDIGVITPYNSQANLIKQYAPKSVEIHTIDKYQGRDKDCILVSFVRSSNNPKNCKSSLLGDWHRINVALTRAKKKLIMVGSQRTLSYVPILKLLMEKVEESCMLNVSKEDIDIDNHQKGELKRCSQLR